MLIQGLRWPLRMLLFAAVTISFALVVRGRVTQLRLDHPMPVVQTQRVGKLYYEACANGDIRVRHAEENMRHIVGLCMTIDEWRAMQDDFDPFVHGLER